MRTTLYIRRGLCLNGHPSHGVPCWVQWHLSALTHCPLGDVAVVIFNHIIKNSNLGTCCEIVQQWVPQKLTNVNEMLTLVQLMAWCHQATSHYLSQCWPRSMLPYGVARPQWANPCSAVSLFVFFNHGNIFTFSILSRHLDPTGSRNYFSWRIQTQLSDTVNTMAVDVLAPCVARASAIMVMT